MDLKVKKFRIHPRLPSVSRILKGQLAVRQLSSEMEEALAKEAESFSNLIVPLAFYKTWSQEECPPNFQEVLSKAGYPKAVAVSFLVGTIGSNSERLLADLLLKGETQRAQFITALSEEAAQSSLFFLFKLLMEDARTDDCEISDLLPILDLASIQNSLNLLEAAQEGISIDQAGHLTPRFTRVALAAWCPLSRKRRQLMPIKKRLI